MDIPSQSEIETKDFTQKDLMQFLLHSTQHAATREELDSVRKGLKEDISKLEVSLKEDISRLEVSLKEDISRVESNILKLESNQKQDILKLESNQKEDVLRLERSITDGNNYILNRLDKFMIWSLGFTVTSTFAILGFIYKLMEKVSN